MTGADLLKTSMFTLTNLSVRNIEMTRGTSHLYLRMDIVSLTIHVWLMDQRTRITSVIYATPRGLSTSGLIMKVTVLYLGCATNLETSTAQIPAVSVILL